MTDPTDASGTGEGGKPAPSSDSLAEVAARMMAGQAQALALMTAWGMGVTGKMASIWLDAVKDAPDRQAGTQTPESGVGDGKAQAGAAADKPRAGAAGAPVTQARPRLSVVGGTMDKAPAPDGEGAAAKATAGKGATGKNVKAGGAATEAGTGKATTAKGATGKGAAGKGAAGKGVAGKSAAGKGAAGKSAIDKSAGTSKSAIKSGAKNEAAAGQAVAHDDLKQIGGIGPRLEKVLNGMGITRLEHLARMSGADLKKLDESLGLDNRAIRDDWPSKAKALLEGGHGEAEG